MLIDRKPRRERATRLVPPALSRSGSVRLVALSLGLLLFFNLIEDFSFFRTIHYQALRRDVAHPVYNALAYVGIYGLCLLSLTLLYCHALRPVRLLALVVTALSLAVFLGFKSTNGYGFTYHEASLVLSETEYITDALTFFSLGYVGSLVFSLGATLALGWIARAHLPRIRSLAILVLPLVAAYLGNRMLEATYSKVSEFPTPFRVPLLGYYAHGHQMLYYGEREEPYLAPADDPIVDHIVLIVGESIAGDMLGINGGRPGTTPYLDSISDRIFNYGVIPAPSNLSSTTSIILQSGLRPDQIPDRMLRSLKNPNVFSYAQKAGFKAFMIDAQIYSAKPANFMTGFDLEKLDGHVLVRPLHLGLPEYEIDLAAIDHIRRIVSENDRSFVYFLTTGAHFPYDQKYPATERLFEPTLSMGGVGGNREKTLNSYANALRWSVDELSRRLVEALGELGERTLVIYTADHGQSLEAAVDDEGSPLLGMPARWPHAIPVDPPREQAMVPLILIPFGEGVHARLGELYEPALVNRVSGFELFSTVLRLAGYAEADVQRHYSSSIFDATADRSRRVFVSGNLYGMGGGFYQNRLVRSACFLNEYEPASGADAARAE